MAKYQVNKAYLSFFQRPTAAYILIVTSTALLTGLGIVMVLSSSSVKAFETTGSTYSIFFKQLLFIGIGGVTLYLAIHLKQLFWERIARWALVVGACALATPFAPVIGRDINGNRSWIGFGSFTVQPSEFAKFMLILWCALILRRINEREERVTLVTLMKSLSAAPIVFIFLVLIGKDLGDSMILMGIIFALLFISGVESWVLMTAGLAGLGTIALAVFTSANRLARFSAVLDPFAPGVYKLAGWQTAHSIMGLASGGFFGVGLGASRQKWANLSEANTDFIFSVIGEELGLLGTLLVLILYAALLYGIFRTAQIGRAHV